MGRISLPGGGGSVAVPFADNATTATGTDAAKAVTPAGLKSVTDTLAARPVTGLKVCHNFVYTDVTIARPTVPSYVSINWIGPAGSGGAAPTNIATGDTWDLQS